MQVNIGSTQIKNCALHSMSLALSSKTGTDVCQTAIIMVILKAKLAKRLAKSTSDFKIAK